MDPSTTLRAPAGKASPVPPGSDQRLVNPFGIPVKFKLEVNPFHPVTATGMRTVGVVIVNVW
jgi:hypothetical protein